MSTSVQHVYVILKLACLLSYFLIQWSVTKLKEEVRCIKYMFLKNKALTMHLVHSQHHILYIYMVCLISSGLLILTKKNFTSERHFLMELMKLLPTYFTSDKNIFFKGDFLSYLYFLCQIFVLFFCFIKMRCGVFICKMRR